MEKSSVPEVDDKLSNQSKTQLTKNKQSVAEKNLGSRASRRSCGPN